MTVVQRFGSALNLNLNVHVHMLFLDGVYRTDVPGSPVLRPVAEPGADALQSPVGQMAKQSGRCLEKCGLIERDIENA